jgi:hypothetical protein
VSRHRGRVCVALAAKMQQQFPFTEFLDMNREVVRVPLLWEAANLYPALGCYRTDTTYDCWRWEGWCKGVREDGTHYNMWHVGGYTTMTELIRPGELTIGTDGEVTIEKPAT